MEVENENLHDVDGSSQVSLTQLNQCFHTICAYLDAEVNFLSQIQIEMNFSVFRNSGDDFLAASGPTGTKTEPCDNAIELR